MQQHGQHKDCRRADTRLSFDPVDARPLRIARYTDSSALLVGELACGGKEGRELAYRFKRFGKGVHHV